MRSNLPDHRANKYVSSEPNGTEGLWLSLMHEKYPDCYPTNFEMFSTLPNLSEERLEDKAMNIIITILEKKPNTVNAMDYSNHRRTYVCMYINNI